MQNAMRTAMITALLVVLISTQNVVTEENAIPSADSEMNTEIAIVGGLYDLAPKSRLRPSARQAQNHNRRVQILRDMGLIQNRSNGWPRLAVLGLVLALGLLHPALGLVGAVGAVLEAPEAETEKTEKIDFKALLKEKAEEQTWAIVKPMLEGDLPKWVRPWRCEGVDVTVPFNADPQSKAHNGFTGGNRIRLSPLWTGYNIPIWATTRQWYNVAKRIGFDFSKETGQPVIKESARDAFTVTLRPLPDKTNTWFEEKLDRHGNPVVNPKTGKVKLVKRYGVQFGKFAYTAMLNIEQTNLPVEAVAALADFKINQPERVVIEGASDIDEMCLKNVAGTTLNHGGDRACFWPSRDHIDMPHPDTFTENGVSALDAYSATLLHEFAHASGHHSRLRRSQKSGGDLNYAREELVAEMASMICCHALGIEMDGPIHGTYLKGWANRAIGQHQKDEDSDAWMTECQTLLRKAMEASEWVLYGTMPEWLQRERTRPSKDEDKTEEDEDAQDAEIVFYRATIDEIDGGGSNAPSQSSEEPTTIEWNINTLNAPGFEKMAKRIQKAFDRRGLTFEYEVKDAVWVSEMRSLYGVAADAARARGEPTEVEFRVMRTPVSVTYSPLTDKGYEAMATLVPFDPSVTPLTDTEMLIRPIPTTEEDEDDRNIWISGELAKRFGGGNAIQYDPTICDHCGVRNHNRKKLVLVKDTDNADADALVIGSSCLYDYTGVDPDMLEKLFTIRANHSPYEGLETDPLSWRKNIAKMEITEFVDLVAENAAIFGSYRRGLGGAAFGQWMGYTVKEYISDFDRWGKPIDPTAAYRIVSNPRPKYDNPNGPQIIERPPTYEAVHAEGIRKWVLDALEASVKENQTDTFGRTLATVQRAGYVTYKTANFVAGSSSRYWKETTSYTKEIRDAAKSTDLTAFPAQAGTKWTGNLVATIADIRWFDDRFNPGVQKAIVTFVTDEHRLKTFSSAKWTRSIKKGQQVTITGFTAKKTEDYQGQGSLVVTYLNFGEAPVASLNAVGAFGLVPALLDPSMASMVALGVAMVVGAVGRTKTTEEPTSCVPACIAEEYDPEGPAFGNDSGEVRGQHFDTCHNLEEMVSECVGEDPYTGRLEHIHYSRIKCNCLDIAMDWYEESEFVRRVLKDEGVGPLTNGGHRAESSIVADSYEDLERMKHPERFDMFGDRIEEIRHVNMLGQKYDKKDCQFLHCESCGEKTLFTPCIDADGEFNLVCEVLNEDSVECGHIYWGMGAFSLLPALLDPSLTTLVALGVAMVAGTVRLSDLDKRKIRFETEGVNVQTLKHPRVEAGQVWKTMLTRGEQEILDGNFSDYIAIRNGGRCRYAIQRYVIDEDATLTLAASVEENNDEEAVFLGCKEFRLKAYLVTGHRKKYNRTTTDVATVNFRLEVQDVDADGDEVYRYDSDPDCNLEDVVDRAVMVTTGLSEMKIDVDSTWRSNNVVTVDAKLVGLVSRMNDIVSDGLYDAFGLREDMEKDTIAVSSPDGKATASNPDNWLYRAFTAPWVLCGASDIADLAEEAYEAWESLNQAKEFHKATEASQKALDTIERYGGLPVEKDAPEAAWEKLSASRIETLTEDLELTRKRWGNSTMTDDVERAIKGNKHTGSLAYIERKANRRWSDALKKSGSVRLLKTFFHRDNILDRAKKDFAEAIKAYVKVCEEKEVCWTEAIVQQGRFQSMMGHFRVMLENDFSEPVMRIWANGRYDSPSDAKICRVGFMWNLEPKTIDITEDCSPVTMWQERAFDCDNLYSENHLRIAYRVFEGNLVEEGLLGRNDSGEVTHADVMYDGITLSQSDARAIGDALGDMRRTTRFMSEHLIALHDFQSDAKSACFGAMTDNIRDEDTISDFIQGKVVAKFRDIMDDRLPTEEVEA